MNIIKKMICDSDEKITFREFFSCIGREKTLLFAFIFMIVIDVVVVIFQIYNKNYIQAIFLFLVYDVLFYVNYLSVKRMIIGRRLEVDIKNKIIEIERLINNSDITD